MGIRILGLLKLIFGFLRIEIYKDNKLVAQKVKFLPMGEIKASRESPDISLFGKKLIKGYIDNSSGSLAYDISFNINGYFVDLHFISDTEGWKGHVPGSRWIVAMPYATVSGKLIVDNKEILAKGAGYHDHNWNVTPPVALNHGWFWGKTNSQSFSIVWSAILRKKNLFEPLIVVNEKNNGYYNIDPSCINFKIGDLRRFGRKKIPYHFSITADDNLINLELDMKVLDIHHAKIMGVFNYWRYLINYIGFISSKGKEEKIGETRIAEFLIFG